MNKTSKIIELLNKHYQKNLELGIIYNNLNLLAQSFNMNNLSKYIKDLSDDKLTIHKDKITNFLISIGANLENKIDLNINLQQFKSVKEIVEFIYNEESKVRQEIKEFCDYSLKELNYEAFEFIQWFVKDGLKDFNEVEYIYGLLKNSNDLLLIDMNIKELLK